MFITLTIEAYGEKVDVRLDSEQKISEGFRILQERGQLPKGDIPNYFRSHINRTLVSAFKTFEEESIFEGDVLKAIENSE